MPPKSKAVKKPDWLDARVYANLKDDKATPKSVRTEALKRVIGAPDNDAAKVAFAKYISGATIPDKPASVGPDANLNHLFYSMGFFARIAEVVGSGDELTVAAEFNKLRDERRPRRERRKLLTRIGRLMAGAPIRASANVWLYKSLPSNGAPAAPHVLRVIEPCVPWQLALPRVSSGSEYVHFAFSSAAISNCRTPNCRDAGYENLTLWKHGGMTNPHAGRPAPCHASGGCDEVIASTPNYEIAIQPLGWCSAT